MTKIEPTTTSAADTADEPSHVSDPLALISSDAWAQLTRELESCTDYPLPHQESNSIDSLRGVLTTITGTAGVIGRVLDTLRQQPSTKIVDVETAAALRVELDQAAAAAEDLHHAVSSALSRLNTADTERE